ncbi:hypothetical protein NADE_003112 [Nannochloris sp. 'desiccata']|nr:hypothetical protein KSW81_000834 [Chlorella desiccata (nom. nud.)]KAH7620494.1 hypothetical protein NADE_003112 [Chlorella desiccata (nom. nud.)]
MYTFKLNSQQLAGPTAQGLRACKIHSFSSLSKVSRGRLRERTLLQTQAAIPGPLYLSSSPADRTRLNAVNNFSSFVPFPGRDDPSTKRTPPFVRVRLSVEFRVHSRQMLCVGGSAIPFGWSFLSIAKVPMSWQPTDIWQVDVELPAGSRVEYKYVILEEQDWTRQVNESTEGTVEYSYRIAPETTPPDVQHITKQMAIVGWQAGSNRVLQVPDEAELAALVAGEAALDRPMTPTLGPSGGRVYGQQALGKGLGGGTNPPPSSPAVSMIPPSASDASTDYFGVWERLGLDEEAVAKLEQTG